MPQAPDRTLAQLDALLDRHLADPDYSLDALCAELGLSRSRLFRIVKQHTGLSVSRYWRQRRLLRARHLLATTTLRVAEIADQTGHDSPQAFSRTFSEEFGLSPSEFRKSAPPEVLPEAAPPVPAPVLLPPTAPPAPPAARPLAARGCAAGPGAVGGVLRLANHRRGATTTPPLSSCPSATRDRPPTPPWPMAS